MKKIFLLFSLLISLGASTQTNADTLAIKEVALNYVEGFFTADTNRLKSALSENLVKRIIDNRNGSSELTTIGRADLLSYVSVGRIMPDPHPSEPFVATVEIYDISSDIALAKISTNKMSMFFDYVQLGKINGEWKIINVLWAFEE